MTVGRNPQLHTDLCGLLYGYFSILVSRACSFSGFYFVDQSNLSPLIFMCSVVIISTFPFSSDNQSCVINCAYTFIIYPPPPSPPASGYLPILPLRQRTNFPHPHSSLHTCATRTSILFLGLNGRDWVQTPTVGPFTRSAPTNSRRFRGSRLTFVLPYCVNTTRRKCDRFRYTIFLLVL